MHGWAGGTRCEANLDIPLHSAMLGSMSGWTGSEQDETDLGIGTERWVRIREAARIASVDPRTIRRWADTGRIRARVTPGGHRQVSVEGLGAAYGPADRSRRALPSAPVDVAPDVAVPEWSASASLWRLWRPHGRLSDDTLGELRLEISSLRRSLSDLEEIVSEELRARDRRAAGETE